MKQDAEENLELRRYLLRKLTGEDTLRVEARLFLEGEYLQQLYAAEDDLVDEYVYKELSGDERERFETHFLSDPDRRKDIKIAEALKKYTSSEYVLSSPQVETEYRDVAIPQPRQTLRTLIRSWSPVVRLSFAAAVTVIVLGGLWLISKTVLRQNQPPPIQAQLPAPQGGQVNPERRSEENVISNQEGNGNAQHTQGPQYVAHGGREQSTNANEIVSAEKGSRPRRKGNFALLLPVGPVRDGGGAVNKVPLPAHANAVHLHLVLLREENGRSYEATLRADDGRSIKTWTGLSATRSKSGKVVSIKVPGRLLGQKNYSVALRGVAPSGEVRDISTYPFQVQK